MSKLGKLLRKLLRIGSVSEATISQLYVDPETHAIKVMTSHGDTGNSNGPHLHFEVPAK